MPVIGTALADSGMFCAGAELAGNEIVDRKTWPGRYIPLVPFIGEETVIDGKMDRKGHTRALIDAQKMYNYWNSAAVEQVALQGSRRIAI